MMAGAIARSTSSTAAIGYIFLPFFALALFGLPFGVAGACFGYLRAKRTAGELLLKPAPVFAGVILAAVALGGVYSVREGHFLSEQVHRVSQMNPSELQDMMSSPSLGKNKYILGAIAQNPHATPDILHEIATISDPELHERMGSMFDLLGANRKGLAVMRLVARHPNVRPDTLELLAKSTDDYVLSDVARNEKLSERTLRELSKKGGYLIEWGISANPKAPIEILARLAQSSDRVTRDNVARNPHAPAGAVDGGQ
jgi:hypothetical protein